jgi:uracil-DNA glycosylase family 4
MKPELSKKRPAAASAVASAASIDAVAAGIVTCTRCPRLRSYCRAVARDKNAAHGRDEYWGRPVPGFGDPDARLLILGLAPAAHGANRTGRLFTGDVRGGSSEFLMAALHRAGLASLATSEHPGDGLRLTDAYLAAAVRCAPPENKPAPEELAACLDHLVAEVGVLPRVRVVLALGRIAWNAWFQLLARTRGHVRPRPPFAHGAIWSGDPLVVGAFHPSRQNTNTGKLTARMYDELFGSIVSRLGDQAGREASSHSGAVE